MVFPALVGKRFLLFIKTAKISVRTRETNLIFKSTVRSLVKKRIWSILANINIAKQKLHTFFSNPDLYVIDKQTLNKRYQVYNKGNNFNWEVTIS